MLKVAEYKTLAILILLSLIIHEAGHVIVGGGIKEIHYAPDFDVFTFHIAVNHWSVWSQLAGLAFTLPMLLFRIHPKFLFLVMVLESRWDLTVWY